MTQLITFFFVNHIVFTSFSLVFGKLILPYIILKILVFTPLILKILMFTYIILKLLVILGFLCLYMWCVIRWISKPGKLFIQKDKSFFIQEKLYKLNKCLDRFILKRKNVAIIHLILLCLLFEIIFHIDKEFLMLVLSTSIFFIHIVYMIEKLLKKISKSTCEWDGCFSSSYILREQVILYCCIREIFMIFLIILWFSINIDINKPSSCGCGSEEDIWKLYFPSNANSVYNWDYSLPEDPSTHIEQNPSTNIEPSIHSNTLPTDIEQSTLYNNTPIYSNNITP